MEDIDEAKHSAVMQAAGTDKRGQGGAKATIVSSVAEAAGGATTVNVNTDYHITGRLARFGRGGMIEEISNRLLGEFAASLQGMLAGTGDPPPVVETKAEPAAPAAPSASAEAAPEFAAAGNGGAASAPPSPPPPSEPIATPSEPITPPVAPIAPPLPAEAVASPQPVASVVTPPSDPVPPPTPPTAGPATESEPLDAVSLMRAVVVKKVKTNPMPYVGAVVGFVIGIGLLRRRR
jgi:hypothetical protein